jgi:hypothetical protein
LLLFVIPLLVVIKTMPHVHHVRVPQKFHNSELAVFKPLILKHFFNRHRLVRRRTQRFIYHPEGTVTDHALRFVTLN